MIVALELTAEQVAEIAEAVALRLRQGFHLRQGSGGQDGGQGGCAVDAEKRKKPYTVPEAAELLGVSRDTIYRMVAAKRLGRVPGSAVVRIPAGEMERVLSGEAPGNQSKV